MSKPSYQTFVFQGYAYDKASRTLKLRYGFDDKLSFEEQFIFDFAPSHHDPEVLDRAFSHLFFLAGVSYYKAYRTENIRIDHGKLDKKTAAYMSEVYQKGLGEYFYVNKLDPKTEIPFVSNAPEQKPLTHKSNGGLVIGIGGGKDSLLTVELLRSRPNVATWALGHRDQLSPLVKEIGLPHYWVERKIDPLIMELANHGALNGHIPISAIFSCVGTIVAILSGHRDSVVSNENSSNEATLEYSGVEINHQYSKSSAYETLYQKLLADNFGDSLRYYSFLRPLSEVRIAELFAKYAFDKYKSLFSSCNRAFVQGSKSMSWCGQCPKCAFTFLALTPFIERQELEKIWHKNLLLDPTLIITYENLIGLSGDKPLDCVGEVKESRAAMQLAKQNYPGLNYQFDIPKDYDYKEMAKHDMPEDLAEIIYSSAG